MRGGGMVNPFNYPCQLQMMGLVNQKMMGGIWGGGNPQQIHNAYAQTFSGADLLHNLKPKKRPHCAHCGRPIKDMFKEDSCKGCGSWEVEMK